MCSYVYVEGVQVRPPEKGRDKMAIKSWPVDMSAYELMLTADPEIKVNKDTGEVIADRETGAPMYIVMAFAKPPTRADGTRSKGEELKITVRGMEDGLEEGMTVALIAPEVGYWAMKGRGDAPPNAGFSYQAEKIVKAPKRKKTPAAA